MCNVSFCTMYSCSVTTVSWKATPSGAKFQKIHGPLLLYLTPPVVPFLCVSSDRRAYTAAVECRDNVARCPSSHCEARVCSRGGLGLIDLPILRASGWCAGLVFCAGPRGKIASVPSCGRAFLLIGPLFDHTGGLRRPPRGYPGELPFTLLPRRGLELFLSAGVWTVHIYIYISTRASRGVQLP